MRAVHFPYVHAMVSPMNFNGLQRDELHALLSSSFAQTSRGVNPGGCQAGDSEDG